MDKAKWDNCLPYILWQDYGCEGWSPQEFRTIREALDAPKFQMTWIITKKFNYKVVESD
jgi:hypothetical protein